MHDFEPAIRVDFLDASVDAVDFESPKVFDPEYQLLRRLERERRIHLDLGLDREASGIGFAMLMIWQLATSRQSLVDILVGDDMRMIATS
jgi:hypothetical protein